LFRSLQLPIRKFWGFCSGAVEVSVLLKCGMSLGDRCLTFWDSMVIRMSIKMDILTLEDETTMLSSYLKHQSSSVMVPWRGTDTLRGSKLYHSLSRKLKKKNTHTHKNKKTNKKKLNLFWLPHRLLWMQRLLFLTELETVSQSAQINHVHRRRFLNCE